LVDERMILDSHAIGANSCSFESIISFTLG